MYVVYARNLHSVNHYTYIIHTCTLMTWGVASVFQPWWGATDLDGWEPSVAKMGGGAWEGCALALGSWEMMAGLLSVCGWGGRDWGTGFAAAGFAAGFWPTGLGLPSVPIVVWGYEQGTPWDGERGEWERGGEWEREKEREGSHTDIDPHTKAHLKISSPIALINFV